MGDKVGYVIREANTEYFYFAVDPKMLELLEVGGIVKIEKNQEKYFAIIEDIQSVSIEEDRVLDYEAIEYIYGEVKKPEFVIKAKAVFIDKVKVPPTPGDPVKLPNEEEITRLYMFEDPKRIFIGNLKVAKKEIQVYAKIKELIIRHTGIFGITGSGKSTTTAHLIKELISKNIPVTIFDIHRDYILSFNNAIIITFDQKEKELLDRIIHEKGLNSKVLVAKLEFDIIKEFIEEILGLSSKTAPFVYGLLTKILSLNEKLYLEKVIEYLESEEKLSEVIRKLKEKGIRITEKEKSARESLKVRLQKLLDWKLFRRKLEDSGEDLLDLIDKLLEEIRLGEKESVDSIEMLNEDEVILTTKKSKVNVIIFDLYVLSLEEQRVLLDIILEKILNTYKKWKFERKTDILSIVIEEAHRFASKDTVVAERISAVAREGRKFGVGLILVSQIPSKIHEDIISQINNYFLLKLINPKDLDFIRKSCPYISKEYFEALTKLEPGKCLIVGLAVKNPAIVKVVKDVEVGGAEEDLEEKIKERVGI